MVVEPRIPWIYPWGVSIEGAKIFNFNNNLKNEPQEDRSILENLARAQLLALVDKVYCNRFGDD